MRLAAFALLLVACASETTTTPTQASRASCGPTPPEPLTAEACFGEGKDKVQTTSPHAPNYVPPGCPCAAMVGRFPEPDGGWQR